MNTYESRCIHSIKFPHEGTQAFTLIELLSVIAIVGLLATAAIPALGDLTASSRRTQFLSEMTNLLESARQYAVAKNTYVWVAFTSEEAPLCAVVVASKDGLGQGYGADDTWTPQLVDISASGELAQISRVKSLGDFTIETDAVLTKGLGVRAKRGVDLINFPRSIQFSPSGSAKIATGIQGTLVLKTIAPNGRFNDRVKVNGPTGFVQVEDGAE